MGGSGILTWLGKTTASSLLPGLGPAGRTQEGAGRKLFAQIRNLFDLKLDLVFWDTTTTYFEGRGPQMAERGYSKDRRSDCQQLVIGVLMTQDGFPVAWLIWIPSKLA